MAGNTPEDLRVVNDDHAPGLRVLKHNPDLSHYAPEDHSSGKGDRGIYRKTDGAPENPSDSSHQAELSAHASHDAPDESAGLVAPDDLALNGSDEFVGTVDTARGEEEEVLDSLVSDRKHPSHFSRNTEQTIIQPPSPPPFHSTSLPPYHSPSPPPFHSPSPPPFHSPSPPPYQTPFKSFHSPSSPSFDWPAKEMVSPPSQALGHQVRDALQQGVSDQGQHVHEGRGQDYEGRGEQQQDSVHRRPKNQHGDVDGHEADTADREADGARAGKSMVPLLIQVKPDDISIIFRSHDNPRWAFLSTSLSLSFLSFSLSFILSLSSEAR